MSYRSKNQAKHSKLAASVELRSKRADSNQWGNKDCWQQTQASPVNL